MCTDSYSYLLKILVTGVTGFLFKRSSGPYGEFQPIQICKFALFTWLFLVGGEGLFSPFSLQMFSQDSQPSTNKVLYIEQIKRRLKKCCLQKTSTSLVSTKLIVFHALFAHEVERVDSPVSKIIYVPQVPPPRRGVNVMTYLWDNIWRDITKKRPQCDPCLT